MSLLTPWYGRSGDSSPADAAGSFDGVLGPAETGVGTCCSCCFRCSRRLLGSLRAGAAAYTEEGSGFSRSRSLANADGTPACPRPIDRSLGLAASSLGLSNGDEDFCNGVVGRFTGYGLGERLDASVSSLLGKREG